MSLHGPDDELLILSYIGGLFDLTVAEGYPVDVGGPYWLRPGSPEYDAWSAPFSQMEIRNIGCPPRDSLEPGSNTETPLVLAFESDEGPVIIHDRNMALAVPVGGQSLDVFVSQAYSRNELTCGDCAATEIGFMAIRSAVR